MLCLFLNNHIIFLNGIACKKDRLIAHFFHIREVGEVSLFNERRHGFCSMLNVLIKVDVDMEI